MFRSGPAITHATIIRWRCGGRGASEFDGRSEAANEIAALWAAIEKSVKAIHGAYEGVAMHRVAA